MTRNSEEIISYINKYGIVNKDAQKHGSKKITNTKKKPLTNVIRENGLIYMDLILQKHLFFYAMLSIAVEMKVLKNFLLYMELVIIRRSVGGRFLNNL